MLIIMSTHMPAKDSVSIFKLAGKLPEKGEEIAFLHIQDACKAVTSAEYCSKLLEAGIKIHALRTDVDTRKLTGKIHRSVELIDYKQWINLLMDKHGKIVSWTG